MLRAVEYSHQVLREHLAPGDMVIDATAGNGHDTLFLARLTGPGGMVFAFDVQDAAVSATRSLLDREGVASGSWEVFQAGHERMRECIPRRWHGRAGAVLFNLGYLPGSDKSVATAAATTVAAMQAGLTMLRTGGLLVAVVYTGHPGGEEEAQAVLGFAGSLPAREFIAMEYRTVNSRNHPPFVLTVQKNPVVE